MDEYDDENDPFEKAIYLLDDLVKLKRKEEVEDIKRNILEVIKDGKYNVKRTEYNKKIGEELKLRKEPFEMTNADMFKLIARMKIDPRLRRSNPYIVKNILKQLIRDNIISREMKIDNLKHGITVVVQTLKIKNEIIPSI